MKDWPITVWAKTPGRSPPPEDRPFALFERGPRGLRLTAANPRARAGGAVRGAACADAQAACPGLITAPCEPERDAAALKRLALWGERYSPVVAMDVFAPELEGLFIDVSGAAHLFGGEQALLADIRARLAAMGAPANAAMADTAGAAWGLARFSDEAEAIAAPGDAREALADLPLAALRLDDEALRLAGRLGLKRVHDLHGLPRSALARRFRGPQGLALVRRLDQALGAAAEPLIGERAAPRYRAWDIFAEPLIDIGGVEECVPRLAASLAGALERDGQGARKITLTAFRVDGRTTAVTAGLGVPSRSPAHLMRLLRDKGLERLDLGFGADALMLSADEAAPLILRQSDIDARIREGGILDAGGGLALLLDRLQARLGEDAVLAPHAVASRLPERAEAWRPAGLEAPPPGDLEGRDRPSLLFYPPEPVEALAELPDGCPARFKWRRVHKRVVRSEGPERLAGEWWRPQRPDRPARIRDYYKVEDEDGRRWWLFREGLYGRDDQDQAPSWWMHGAFA